MNNELKLLADFVSNLQYEQLPGEVVEAAKMRIADTISVVVGGSSYKLSEDFVHMYKNSDLTDEGEIWGTDLSADLRTSVFLNGLNAHVLELDDVHTYSKTHCGAVVIPAAWNLGRKIGASGKAVILAVVSGYEVMSRIGKAFGVTSHRAKGWHATATAGTFGAAAACAKLWDLDFEKVLNAFGMAGTQSFGRWAFLEDGSNCKAMHTGRAAECGLDAAILAKTGMTGPEHILEAADGGLLNAMSEDYDIQEVSKGLGTEWNICAVDVKPYASCRSTHPAIDAALALSREGSLDLRDVKKIEIDTYQIAYMQCGEAQSSRSPTSVSQAKFSIPFVVACALTQKEVGITHFSDDYYKNPEICALMERTTVRPCSTYTDRYPEHWGCQMTIYCKDGKQYQKEIMDATGSVDNPIDKQNLRAKMYNLMYEAYGSETEPLITALFELDSMDRLCSLRAVKNFG